MEEEGKYHCLAAQIPRSNERGKTKTVSVVRLSATSLYFALAKMVRKSTLPENMDGPVTPCVEENQESELQNKKKRPKHYVTVRRSERIKTAAADHVTLTESDKDEPEPEPDYQLHQVLPPNLSLEEKLDCALQKIEALDKIAQLLKSKVDEIIGSCEPPSAASVCYRTMYIDLKKEVEALTDENRRLSGRLENALGRIEVYEKENRVLIEVLDKMKDAVNAVVVSNLAKTTEAAVNASAQAIRNVASAAKRKRNAQQS